MTPTETTIHQIWTKLLPSPPAEIPLDESFFDLGGHSILATRLIFELRQSLAVGAPLGLVFDYPTIRALAKELDHLRDADLGLAGESTKSRESKLPVDTEYSDDEAVLVTQLRDSYEKPTISGSPRTVFLTGATGFLGAFILRDLLSRSSEVKKVICHVRAGSVDSAMSRLRESGQGRGAWEERWVSEGLVEVVTGDLDSEKLGMSEENWTRIANESEVIIHNGALVSLPPSHTSVTDELYRFTGCTRTRS